MTIYPMTCSARTELVRGICSVYDLFWALPEDCICSECEGVWPHIYKDGAITVCRYHEWMDKKPVIQQRLVRAGLSLPVKEKSSDRVAKWVMDHYGTVTSNPLQVLTEPMISRSHGKNAQAAKEIADHMSWAGHIVALVHRSQAVNVIYAQREEEMEDVLLSIPVLVWWNNRDMRNHNRAEMLVRTRDVGYTFILDE